MYVKQLEFRNYRNLNDSVFTPEKGINVICGNNAQGKTNIIECLWLFTGGRSFRGSKEKDMKDVLQGWPSNIVEWKGKVGVVIPFRDQNQLNYWLSTWNPFK